MHKQHGVPPIHLDEKGERERGYWEKIKSTDLNRVKSHANQRAAKRHAKTRQGPQNKKGKKK